MSKGVILVVDDTVANLEVVSQVLEDAGFDIATAISGDRALKLVNTHPPDLILLDVQMPGIDGFSTCQQLKANPQTASIPVIFMTALSDTESKIKGFDLGAVDYITKPFQEKELLARVKTHIQLRQWNQNLENQIAERTHELQITLEQLKQSQLQLVQSEKMSSLGNLVAGVAHEINNPLGFLNGSLVNTHEFVHDLLAHLRCYQQEYKQPNSKIIHHAKKIDLEYICDDLPKIVHSMQAAVQRIQKISDSLRVFSRNDTESQVLADLHEGIDSTLLILKYRLQANQSRPEIQVITDYGDLPYIECFPGQLNQVFINILANAIDVLDESNTGRSFAEIKENPNIITIKTFVDNQYVKISIADNGKGMSDEVKQKIFDHLFTTKPIGKGTGLGLAIARQIVEESHGGKLSCYSVLGKGTEFIIALPFAT
ncbi:response regulator [Nostoc sp. FACHB-280]|uniref:hybrid sensor histidine kinase/response regulator n=1 Tax=Nostoc sp. FACHB-280 TaxID=2692839 RepID=UPI00168A874D|nr:response regulator [Nostoc sp. FACHB-280]MBD2497718.1 hybrid sensor histidine kinase/response regulator [Nostoc sp. FACHB-280]